MLLIQHSQGLHLSNLEQAPQLPLYSSEELDILGFLIQDEELASVAECMLSMSQAVGSIPNIKIKQQRLV